MLSKRTFLESIKDFLKDLLREIPVFFRLLPPRARKALAAVCVILLLAAAFALRPPSAVRTVELYVDYLHQGECRKALNLMAEESKELDVQVNFHMDTCEQTASMFQKLFAEMQYASLEKTERGRAELEFDICVLPVGFTRRACARHTASLKKEGLRWKIVYLEIGSWASPRNFRREKIDALINPESRLKKD